MQIKFAFLDYFIILYNRWDDYSCDYSLAPSYVYMEVPPPITPPYVSSCLCSPSDLYPVFSAQPPVWIVAQIFDFSDLPHPLIF